MKTFINKLQAGDNTAQLKMFGVLMLMALTALVIAYFTGHYKLDVLHGGI